MDDIDIQPTTDPARPKSPLRAWFDVRGRSVGTLGFALNRLTAIGLTIYLFLHLAVLSLLLRGPEGWDSFVRIARSPLFLTLDVVLLFGGTDVLSDRDWLPELRRAHPNAILFGCSTAGEICDTRVRDDSLVATTVALQGTTLEVRHTEVQPGIDTSEQAGVTLAEAGPEVTALSQRLGIPVITSPNGMGCVPADDPMTLGFIGRNGAYPANQAGRHADLVLTIGAGDITTVGPAVVGLLGGS